MLSVTVDFWKRISWYNLFTNNLFY